MTPLNKVEIKHALNLPKCANEAKEVMTKGNETYKKKTTDSPKTILVNITQTVPMKYTQTM